MNNLLGIDNPVMRFLSRVFDLIILNICFLICCIPLVTIGPSITALYSVCLKIVKNEDSYIVKGFFKAFVQNFKTSLMLWLFLAGTGILLGIDLWAVFSSGAGFIQFFIIPLVCLAFLWFGILIYGFPMIAHYKYNLMKTIIHSISNSLRHFLSTLLLIICIAAFIGIHFYSDASLSIALAIDTIIGFSCLSCVYSFYFRKIFSDANE